MTKPKLKISSDISSVPKTTVDQAKKDEKKLEVEKNILVELENINGELIKGNSFKRKFLQGLLTGFGTFLGASVLVTLLILLLTQLATIQFLKPIVQDIVKTIQNGQNR